MSEPEPDSKVSDLQCPDTVAYNKEGKPIISVKIRDDWHHILFQKFEENFTEEDREKMDMAMAYMLLTARRMGYEVFDHAEIADGIAGLMASEKFEDDKHVDRQIKVFDHASGMLVDLDLGVMVIEREGFEASTGEEKEMSEKEIEDIMIRLKIWDRGADGKPDWNKGYNKYVRAGNKIDAYLSCRMAVITALGMHGVKAEDMDDDMIDWSVVNGLLLRYYCATRDEAEDAEIDFDAVEVATDQIWDEEDEEDKEDEK